MVSHLHQEKMRPTPLRPSAQEQWRLKLDLISDAWRRERRNEQATAGIGGLRLDLGDYGRYWGASSGIAVLRQELEYCNT